MDSLLAKKYFSATRWGAFLVGLVFVIGVWSCTEEALIQPKTYGIVRGQVLLFDTKQGVAKASVRLSPTGRIVDTDSAGNFKFDSVSVGKYTLQATKVGYRIEVSTLEVEDSRTSTLTFFLTDDRTQNRPPDVPFRPSPIDGATMVGTAVKLAWKSKDLDRADSALTYDVIFFREGESSAKPFVTSLRADSLIVKDLRYNSTYYWQVIVKDRFTTVLGEVWSFKTKPFPDQSYIFSKRVDGQLQIFSSNAQNDEIQLTKNASNWRPVFGPDRQRIAFISNVETDLHLYTMNRDGTQVRKISSAPISGISPTDLSFCWSPDGTRLLYPSNDKLYSVRADGGDLTIVAQAPAGRFFSGCDWTEQGNRIAVRTTGGSVYDNELQILNAGDGTVARNLGRQTGRTGNPVFSIDGKQIAYTRDIRAFENAQGRQLDARIFLYDIASFTEKEISGTAKTAGTNDLDPRFSPNGARIIFTNTNNDGNSQRNIFTVDLAGANRAALISSGEMPYWR